MINVRDPKLTHEWKGIAFILMSAFGFSTLGIFGKLIYAEGLNITSTLALRFLGASFILWIWLWLRQEWRVSKRDAFSAISLGMLGYAGQAAFLFSALKYTSAGIATLLLYSYPAIVTLLAWLIEGERPTLNRSIALASALVGCLLIADLTGPDRSLTGILLGLASGLWYSFYLLLSARLVNTLNPIVSSAYISLGAAVSFVGAATAQSTFILPSNLTAVMITMALVIVSTIVPVLSLLAGIQILGISQASILSTVEPLITVLLGMVLLKEKFSTIQAVGGFLILNSVIILRFQRSEYKHQ
ncbi:hypothetical protein C1752_09747 [Acaryochloris thomasi RCC1774]|uniref:EamA domain-containing protein n=1 Tax=Acaryochloris thomasi RCC1774 TaxID=1764569 RepID=A0A2W1J8W7_9CYAN|nr:EamA family transporter [Acaryochloris thomasi]PZD70730.1 hypothetical protein C1752_09747 [Acaryochloris thomasi RCC1774]